jgi:glucose/arabinose dehydrogenase
MGATAPRRLFATLAVRAVRGSAARALPPLQLEPVTSASAPRYVTHAGDERLFVVQRDGRILIHAGGSLLPTPFLDVSALVDPSSGGLFAIAFHPDYGAGSDFFFVAYSTGGPSSDSVVARESVSADPDVADPAGRVELIRYADPTASHTIGQIAFGPGGLLHVGAGDGGAPVGAGFRAQHDDLFYGKMLRIDVDQNVTRPPFYGIPPTNPFAAAGDGILDEIWAKGFRNPWRFSFDRSTGELWIGDVGEDVREEIDREAASAPGGANYGWEPAVPCLAVHALRRRSHHPMTKPSARRPQLRLLELAAGRSASRR